MGGTAYEPTININHRKYYYSSYHPSGEGIPLPGVLPAPSALSPALAEWH